MPIVIFASKQTPNGEQWKEVTDSIIKSLARDGGALPANINICPAFGLDSIPWVGVYCGYKTEIIVGWYDIRTAQQKEIVKRGIEEGVAKALKVPTWTVKTYLMDGKEENWIIHGERVQLERERT